jgi:uncharacterized membrane protein YvbJ
MATAPGEQSALRSPVICTNCQQQNKPDTHFCVKCGMILSFKAHTESIAEVENMKKIVADMQTRQSAIEWALKKLIADESDLGLSDLKDRKRLDEIFKRAVTPKDIDFFRVDQEAQKPSE